MESLKSDYIIIDNCYNTIDQLKENKKYLKELCDRNSGIGANGIIFIEKEEKYLVNVYNRDGTEAKLSGNGLLCATNYLYIKKLVSKNFIIKSFNYEYEIFIDDENNIKINMGKPRFNPKLIPVITDKNIFINEKIYLNNNMYYVTGLSVGNSHLIVSSKNIDNIDLNVVGPLFQNYYIFPDKINIVFSEINNNDLKIRIYEKGNEETKSCATASCASVVAYTINNIIKKNKDIYVENPGGIFKIKYQDDENIILNGKSKIIYKGKI